jgi:hypothetical protein
MNVSTILCTLFFLACLNGFAASQGVNHTVVFYSISDSWLNEEAPDTNYGTVKIAEYGVDEYTAMYYDIVITFNISALIGLNKTIIYAEAWIRQQAEIEEEIIQPDVEISSYLIDPYSWNETTVTWNNPPTQTSDYFIRNYQDYDIDHLIWPTTGVVTTAIANGDHLISFRCENFSPTVQWATRETLLLVNSPQLLITYQNPDLS